MERQGDYYLCDLCRTPMGAPEDEGCRVKTLPLEDGGQVTRVRYGQEPEDWGAESGDPCGDCRAPAGGVHHWGCDVERCGRCGGQLITCECPYAEEIPAAG